MSTPCALCERDDWLDVGICADCAGTDGSELVFVAPVAAATDRLAASRSLRDLIGPALEHRKLDDVTRGRQPLLLLTPSLARRAVRMLEQNGFPARGLPRKAAQSALPLSFSVMVFTVLMVGSMAALRGRPLWLTGSALVAALLLLLAFRVLRTPLLVRSASTALLPVAVRRSLASSLAELDDDRARTLLLDIARTGEATFAALPDAFRTASLGESVVDLLGEAGPLAREAAQLRTIAHELDAHDDHADERRQVADAADARYALLADVLGLLSRLVREGARSDEEIVRLLQLVRDESARRVQAEHIVAHLLQKAPATS